MLALSRKSTYDLKKVKNGVVRGVIRATESASEKLEPFHFLLTPLIALLGHLLSSENQIVGNGSRNERIHQSQYFFQRFVIG